MELKQRSKSSVLNLRSNVLLGLSISWSVGALPNDPRRSKVHCQTSCAQPFNYMERGLQSTQQTREESDEFNSIRAVCRSFPGKNDKGPPPLRCNKLTESTVCQYLGTAWGLSKIARAPIDKWLCFVRQQYTLLLPSSRISPG